MCDIHNATCLFIYYTHVLRIAQFKINVKACYVYVCVLYGYWVYIYLIVHAGVPVESTSKCAPQLNCLVVRFVSN